MKVHNEKTADGVAVEAYYDIYQRVWTAVFTDLDYDDRHVGYGMSKADAIEDLEYQRNKGGRNEN